MIKIYSTPTCPYCFALKSFLKDHNIEFEDIDVSRDDQALQDLVQKTGQMGVPVLEADGKIIVGFDKEKVCELLGIKED